MTRPRVKICGIREPADGVAAVEDGADYIGVVFAERVRRVTPVEAASVVSAIRGRGVAVGVFVDEPLDDVLAVRDVVGFEIAQLHGDEPPAWCARLRADGLSVWKAIRPRAADELARALDRYRDAVDAVLVEGFSPRAAGGTGTSFPHEWLGDADLRDLDLVLAGGLDAQNVGTAIHAVRPDVVDVSSGVESTPGVKSRELVRVFIEAVREAASTPPSATEGRVR
ncbi:MAG: phosphoribosylanthranilate isomerase [Gemmatimonadota bacterium]|nr:phosphoribosylanthranilate isomerase [Gemmatimonadota bacterium]